MTLTEIHRQYLGGHAISGAVIEAAGIWSDRDMIVFPWRLGEQVTEQRRQWPEPDGGLPDGVPKYIWEAGKPLHLAAWREVAGSSPVLLCEGTKQSLAVASWAPPEYSVYGMAGCRGWANSDLSFFTGSQVIIWLDADAGENLDVYEAGERLAALLELEGAFPFFVPSPAWGKDGIDDYLAKVREDRRGVHLAKLAAGAVARAVTKPSPRRPARRPMQVPDTGLPTVFVSDVLNPLLPRRDIIRQIISHLQQRWNGTDLFCYGGGITRLRDGTTEPLGKGAFLRWLAEGVSCVRRTMTSVESVWPDSQTVDAILASADEFALLERVVKMPFVRADGSVSAKNGYDADAATFLAMGNSGMDRLEIPDVPSQADATAAAGRLLGDWLGDMPFLDQSSAAGALALVLTPFIRGLVPLVPLAVISGRQKGTGKNLFTDCFSIVITGDPASPMQWIEDDDDEIRKQVLAAFREGRGLICFDEAHKIRSHTLSRALTAQVYTDRQLGVSEMLSYPNKAVWMALGNNVGVLEDMGRRYHRIDLYSPVPNPEDRPSSDFSHPDLRGWTREHRPELVTDILVMIRAWFAAGCPAYDRGSLMGSFEQWDKMLSGILHYAQVPGFLADMARKRSESDSSGGFWRDHIEWLRGNRGNDPFTTVQVRQDALASLGSWSALPGLDNLSDPGFARKLGQEYARHRDEWSGGLRLVKFGQASGHVAKWMIEEFLGDTMPELGEGEQRGNKNPAQDDRGLQETEGEQGEQGNSSSHAHARAPAHDARAHAHAREGGQIVPSHPLFPPLSFAADIETASADELFTYTPRDDTGFVRLAGALGPSGAPVITDGPGLVALLGAAGTIAGHNFAGFDALALAWHCGADWDTLASKIRDTELIMRQYDPPRSRESGASEDRYGLDAVAERLGVSGKTDDLGRLKTKHGGYDQIPLDDPEYRAYLEGDLAATAAVAERIGGCYDSDPYLRREHELAALAGRMSLNGFLVDQPLLEQRYAEGQQRKREALQVLHDGFGLPLGKMVSHGRGKAKHEEFEAYESPLATGPGRDWLERFWTEQGLADPPRTVKTGKLSIGIEDLKAVAARRPDLAAFCQVMNIVTGTRTVYQTARDCLCSDGRVHPVVSMRQASGRWSVTNPGLTVFGKRGGKHVERDIFLPDSGHVLLSFDLSQVDMRAMAWLSGDHAYRAMFAPGRDAHEEIGAQVGLSRQAAKMVGHGWNYGLGAKRMIAEGMDPVMVNAFISGMEARFPQLIAWREQIREMGKAGMILDNGFHRRMRCDPARAYTVAPALMGQGGARDIMCESLLHLPREFWPMLRVMVHDEIVCSVPKDCAQEVASEIMKAMTWQLDDDLPVLCDVAMGMSWGQASAK
jgi:DNA polymerase-1